MGDVGEVAQRAPHAVEAGHREGVSASQDASTFCSSVWPSRFVPESFSPKNRIHAGRGQRLALHGQIWSVVDTLA
jgi:hypothetical protein